MAEDYLHELWVGDVAKEGFHLDIGKVAVTRGDTLLDRPRALGVGFEEFVVVVRLDEERGEAAQMVDHAGGDVAGIGKQTEADAAALKYESHRIDGIVLDGEAVNREVFDGEILPCFEGFPCDLTDELLADYVGSFTGCEDGCGVFFEEIF